MKAKDQINPATLELPEILAAWIGGATVYVADGGPGDRHYDLALGLWTLNWNLKGPRLVDWFRQAI